MAHIFALKEYKWYISGISHPNEGKEYKWYISGIYCQLNDHMPPFAHLLREPKTTID